MEGDIAAASGVDAAAFGGIRSGYGGCACRRTDGDGAREEEGLRREMKWKETD
uniref:Uncharacterized protein n=1 Tax=Oryza sativa subsp. japonica TaxID=39947 RepID=Q6EQJ0_ORYSJ|nr:hypothetical protein [Oryza sativa Japonica Group]